MSAGRWLPARSRMIIVGTALAVLAGLVPALPAVAERPDGQGPYIGPPPAKTFGYDQLGRTVSVNALGGTETFTYDDRDQLIAAAGPMGAASFTYDAAGRLTDEFDGSYHLTYTYSGYDVRTVTDNQAGVVRTFDRGWFGEVLTETDRSTSGAAGPTRAFTYDNRGRPLTDTTTNPSGAVTASLAYTWDAAGNLTSQTTGGQLANPRDTTYAYDKANRLTRVSDTAGSAVSGADYGWDAAGNRTSVTTWTGAGHTPTGTTTATYDARNRLLGTSGPAGTTTNTWTPRGTLASRNGTALGYDALDRLISDGARSYQYDGLDRLAKVSAGATTVATLGYSGLGAEPVRDGQFTYARSPGGALLSARSTSSGTATSLLSNAHGNVIAGANPGNGAITDTRSYDPFGVVTGSTGTGSNAGFQGSWTDSGTGKVSAQARWYDPAAGAFSSRDSVTVPYAGAASTNRYSYTGANPTTFSDPSGHWQFFNPFAALGNALPKAAPIFNFAARAAPVVAGGLAVGAEIAGGAVACVIGCAALIVGAVIVVVVAGVTVYLLVNADGSYSYQGDATGDYAIDPETGLPAFEPGITPVPRPTPRTAPNPAPTTPRVEPPKTWDTTLAPQTWTVDSQWYDDRYLYLVTDIYTTTITQHWTYFNGITTLTGTTPHTTYNGRKIVVKPLFDTSNPIIIPTPIVGPQEPGKRAEPAEGSKPCAPTSSGPACSDKPHDLPAGADTSGGGAKPPGPPDKPAASNCSPDPTGPLPKGFADTAQFLAFAAQLYAGLDAAGYGSARAAFQGSSVTGVSYKDGIPFDLGRTSDFDIALTGDEIFEAAKGVGAQLRSRGTRTGPLWDRQVRRLGLKDLKDRLTCDAGRPVKFMIYDSLENALNHKPSIEVPR